MKRLMPQNRVLQGGCSNKSRAEWREAVRLIPFPIPASRNGPPVHAHPEIIPSYSVRMSGRAARLCLLPSARPGIARNG